MKHSALALIFSFGLSFALFAQDQNPVSKTGKTRQSAIDQRTTRHPGYAVSQRKRKRVEEIFGWVKTVGLMRKVRHRGRERVAWMFTWTAAIYNLVRMGNLLGATA